MSEGYQYIAFLRAINVGGRVVKMERLRALFSELGLQNVRSYIQSGNVFFESDEGDRTVLRSMIERRLQEALGFEVSVLLRTVGELEEAISLDPFRDVGVTPDTRLVVIFISSPLPATVDLPYRSGRGDFEILKATPGEAFVVIRIIGGRIPNPNIFLEKILGLKATARFYHTAVKILATAKGA